METSLRYPIYKKGNRSDLIIIALYFWLYPFATLRNIIIVVSQIMKHLDQHRFTSEHTCEAQLFLPINDLAKAIDNKAQVDMAILDFKRLSDWNINWSRSIVEYKAIYLDGLGHLLEIVHSKWWLVVPIFRVAQGSVLGPMLFLLCTSDSRTNING